VTATSDGPDALRRLAADWLACGRAAMVVEVLAARGSVPREAGTRMLVAADGCAGTIGGGHLEFQAIAEARQALATGTPALPPRDIALGPSLGQCCGGAVRLGIRRLDAAALSEWPDEPVLFQLQLHGAGHVGQALVRLLATLPCRVQWVDSRDEAAAAVQAMGPLPPHIQLVPSDDPVAEVRAASPGTWFLVMTHSHALDLDLVQAVLARGDAGWLGLIGSATKRARFERRLAERGLGEAVNAQLTCPVGLPGIAGKAPAVVAMAVAAQLLQRTAGSRAAGQASARRPRAATSSTRTL